MIDELHARLDGGAHRPRTYRRVMKKAYLSVAKAETRPAEKGQVVIYRELCAVKRNFGFVDAYLARGGSLVETRKGRLETIRELYRQ